MRRMCEMITCMFGSHVYVNILPMFSRKSRATPHFSRILHFWRNRSYGNEFYGLKRRRRGGCRRCTNLPSEILEGTFCRLTLSTQRTQEESGTCRVSFISRRFPAMRRDGTDGLGWLQEWQVFQTPPRRCGWPQERRSAFLENNAGEVEWEFDGPARKGR